MWKCRTPRARRCPRVLDHDSRWHDRAEWCGRGELPDHGLDGELRVVSEESRGVAHHYFGDQWSRREYGDVHVLGQSYRIATSGADHDQRQTVHGEAESVGRGAEDKGKRPKATIGERGSGMRDSCE